MARLQRLLQARLRTPSWVVAALLGLAAGLLLGYFGAALLGLRGNDAPDQHTSRDARPSQPSDQPLPVGARFPLLPGKWINGTPPRIGAGYRLLVIDVWGEW